MQPIPPLVANILALSIAVLPGAAESTSVEPFCDWEATLKHITIRNGPLRRTDNADREDEDLSALSEDHTGPQLKRTSLLWLVQHTTRIK